MFPREKKLWLQTASSVSSRRHTGLVRRQTLSWIFPEATIKHWLSAAQGHTRHGSYRKHFSDVHLFGCQFFHAVLSKGRRIDCQEIESIRERIDVHLRHHPGRSEPIPQIYAARTGYRVDCRKLVPTKLEGSLYFGTPIEALNWGMWLLQAIPSAIDFLDGQRADRFLAYIERDWQRKLLNAVGIPNEKLVHQEFSRTYHCDELVMKQFSRIDLIPTPMEQSIFARIAGELAGAKNGSPKRRLFLSRRSVTREAEGTYRALLNEDELVEAFSARGYEIVEPEQLPFLDQIRLFAEAELVVGLGGAALFNTIFSPPETRVVTIESSASFVHGHAALFASTGHPFGVIFGKQDLSDETPVQKRWTVDVGGVVSAMDQYE